MSKEMLQIQQYLNIHPVLKMDKEFRRDYVLLLRYFVAKRRKKDIWSRQLLKLYAKRISGESIDINRRNIYELSFSERCKCFKYKYFLLTDILFICAFTDKEEGQKVLQDIIMFYGKRHRKRMEELAEAFYSMGENDLSRNFNELGEIYAIIWKNRRYQALPIKRIMITANMSAGKSTLMNALSGRKVNKTQNDACTAKIHYLYNKAGEDGFNCELDSDLELDASHNILMTDNEDNGGTEIAVGTRFRSLGDIDRSICFIDTPGVNSSMDKQHREISNRAIEKIPCDILLYLFNGENIGSDDDIRHLRFIRKNFNGSIIFLVNKLDHFQKDIDSVRETLGKVQNDLEELGFENAKVYPISAYAGYLAKMSMCGEHLSEDEEDELALLKRKLKREDFSFEKYYLNEITLENKDDAITQLLLHSGVLSLENIIYQ